MFESSFVIFKKKVFCYCMFCNLGKIRTKNVSPSYIIFSIAEDFGKSEKDTPDRFEGSLVHL